MVSLNKLRDLAYKYQHAINYREDSPYWGDLLRKGLCRLISNPHFPGFIMHLRYNPDTHAFPIVRYMFTGSFSQIVYLGPRYEFKIKDVAKEVLQPRLDLLEQFIIELEIQNETLQELSERRD